MPGPLEEAIVESAKGPAKSAGDGQSMEQHPLRDLIDADRYLAGKEAVGKPRRGLRFTKLIPPGAD